jgi:Zn-dependent protease with chaperone function
MNYDAIRLNQEIELGKEIYDLIRGDMVDIILQAADFEENENIYTDFFEGHSYRINEQLFPKLNAICESVIKRLQFPDKIDFFVVNESDSNAFTIPSTNTNTAHVICLHSRLIDSMNETELKFIIGHEIGHLISGNAHITKLLQFIYADSDKMSLFIKNKILFWNKLSELTADRFGFIAAQDFEAVVTCFFKLASGLTLRNLDFNFKAYLEHNNKILEKDRSHTQFNALSHPINPLRLKALQLFSESGFAKSTIQFDSMRAIMNLKTRLAIY